MEAIGGFLALVAFVVACIIVGAGMTQGNRGLTYVGGVSAVVSVLMFVGAIRYGPEYNVWQQGLAGKAQLEMAIQNRQIRIQEAQAKKDSATLEAEAEVIQATGAAKAVLILKESMGGSENYIRWKYINMLSEKKDDSRTIIYVPTESQIPILEANRLPNNR
jgi:hypothetical protein